MFFYKEKILLIIYDSRLLHTLHCSGELGTLSLHWTDQTLTEGCLLLLGQKYEGLVKF